MSSLDRILTYINTRHPVRSAAKRILAHLDFLPYLTRLQLGAVRRPHYAYCVYQSARLAKTLGHEAVSVLELGVAGGKGLIELESHAAKISRLLDIRIEVYGFDTGRGLPKPCDYRDLPYHWSEGFFAMDVAALQSKLQFAKLVLGNLEETAADFVRSHSPAPIAAIMFDLDYYSSTVAALQLLAGPSETHLPRMYCYLDDIIGTETELYNDHTGVRLAIAEYNQSHPRQKFCPAYHLTGRQVLEPWYHQIQIYHDFSHPKYNSFVSERDQQLRLD